MKFRKLLTAAVAIPCLAAGLSACSLADVTSMSRVPAHASSSASPTGASSTPSGARSTAAAQPVTATTSSTFAAGALTHVVSGGTRDLSIRYWTTEPAASWHDGVPSVIQFSATLSGTDTTHTVRVARMLATASQASGTTSTLIDDGSQPIITPPYSYSGVLQLGANAATITELNLEFDVLVQVAPGSTNVYRQAYIDTVSLASGKDSQS
jgi:hypothetical protein